MMKKKKVPQFPKEQSQLGKISGDISENPKKSNNKRKNT